LHIFSTIVSYGIENLLMWDYTGMKVIKLAKVSKRECTRGLRISGKFQVRLK